MGKTIDRAAGLALSAVALYLFFLNAWHSIPLACLLAFLGAVLLRYILRRRPARPKRSVVQAERALFEIACLPECEAQAALQALVGQSQPLLILKHPDAALGINDVFALWKTARGAAHITVAATCGADARVLAAVEALRAPTVTLLDRRRLVRMLQAQPLPLGPEVAPTPAPPLSKRAASALRAILAQPPKPRQLLVALGLLASYALTGRPLYLLLSLALMLCLGCAFIAGRRPL